MMSERDPRFLASIDGFVENALTRICAPSRDRFVTLSNAIPKIAKHWEYGSERQVNASIIRLVKSGRVQRHIKRLAGKKISGIVCLPRGEWTALQQQMTTEFRLTGSDVEFLEAVGVAVDHRDFAEVALVV